jgi:DNA-binding response OmpR family regulator
MAALAHALPEPPELQVTYEEPFRRDRPEHRQSGEFTIERKLWFDTDQCEVGYSTMRVKLTRTEFRLLAYLAERPGEWFSNEHMLTVVLGRPNKRDKALVRVHLWNIRRKLGVLAWCLESHRGQGSRVRIEP